MVSKLRFLILLRLITISTIQLIGKLCCCSLLPCKTLLTNSSIFVVLAVGCCGWLVLVAAASFCGLFCDKII